MHRFVAASLVVTALLIPSLGGASTWQIDPVHSDVEFGVRHLMVSTVRGHLGKVTGTLTLDEHDIAKSSVEATIDATGIDTREPKRDQHLKSPDFLDVAKYPSITFKSKRVAKVSDEKYTVTGDLTLHGVTKEVVLDVEGSPKPFTDPMGHAKMGGSARTKINRQDFGVSWNKNLDNGGVVVGNDLDVVIDLELVQAEAGAH